MASAQPAVRIDSLEKRYASGTLALKGVSFDVEEGDRGLQASNVSVVE